MPSATAYNFIILADEIYGKLIDFQDYDSSTHTSAMKAAPGRAFRLMTRAQLTALRNAIRQIAFSLTLTLRASYIYRH